MKIILDDKRVFPTKGGYNCVRTYEDCALLLITQLSHLRKAI